VIVDDEPAARRGVKLLLSEDPEIEVVGEAGDHDEALALINSLKPDLVFLDIQMPGGSGLELLPRLDFKPLPAVVFVTAYDNHALKAFELHAIDYVLKPIDDERFLDALSHAKQRLRGASRGGGMEEKLSQLLESLKQGAGQAAAPDSDRILIKSSGEILILRADEVDWVEADGDYMKFHVAGKTHLMRETMSRLEERLDARRFVRIHRSVIVNADRIKKLSPIFGGEYAVILRDGTSLKLSRGYHERLSELLRQSI
jgi:two-component system LytT family response regulator